MTMNEREGKIYLNRERKRGEIFKER